MKTNDEKFENSIKFVTSHYEYRAFSARRTWLNVIGRDGVDWRRKLSVAAVACCVIVASAAFLYTVLKPSLPKEPDIENPVILDPGQNIETPIISVRLVFTDTPLKEVIKKIETTYGVKIKGVPDKELRLTLSYEGTAEDVVEAINESLQIDLEIDYPTN